jgi:hypothetical protein
VTPVDLQGVRRVLLHLLGRLIVGHDGHDLVERRGHRELCPAERNAALAVERDLEPDRHAALLDPHQPHVPVLDVDRMDLGGRLERREARAVADRRAAAGDVVHEQPALVHAAVADVLVTACPPPLGDAV